MQARPTEPEVERRVVGTAPFTLVELSPDLVVKGVPVANGLLAPDPPQIENLREQCPYCRSGSLKLVLRRDHVIRSHLFCVICTRCFDCIAADGHSELTPLAMPIY